MIDLLLCWLVRLLVWGGVALLFWPAVQFVWDWWRAEKERP